MDWESANLFLRLHLQLLFQSSPIDVPFLLRGLPRCFFESVRCSSKSDSNGIDHVEHWIFSPHMDGAILQIQDSPTIYTNRHIQ